MQWPSHSPDINAIETVWAHLSTAGKLHYRNLYELIKDYSYMWYKLLTPEYIDNLISRWEDKIIQCYEQKGNKTKLLISKKRIEEERNLRISQGKRVSQPFSFDKKLSLLEEKSNPCRFINQVHCIYDLIFQENIKMKHRTLLRKYCELINKDNRILIERTKTFGINKKKVINFCASVNEIIKKNNLTKRFLIKSLFICSLENYGKSIDERERQFIIFRSILPERFKLMFQKNIFAFEKNEKLRPKLTKMKEDFCMENHGYYIFNSCKNEDQNIYFFLKMILPNHSYLFSDNEFISNENILKFFREEKNNKRYIVSDKKDNFEENALYHGTSQTNVTIESKKMYMVYSEMLGLEKIEIKRECPMKNNLEWKSIKNTNNLIGRLKKKIFKGNKIKMNDPEGLLERIKKNINNREKDKIKEESQEEVEDDISTNLELEKEDIEEIPIFNEFENFSHYFMLKQKKESKISIKRNASQNANKDNINKDSCNEEEKLVRDFYNEHTSFGSYHFLYKQFLTLAKNSIENKKIQIEKEKKEKQLMKEKKKEERVKEIQEKKEQAKENKILKKNIKDEEKKKKKEEKETLANFKKVFNETMKKTNTSDSALRKKHLRNTESLKNSAKRIIEDSKERKSIEEDLAVSNFEDLKLDESSSSSDNSEFSNDQLISLAKEYEKEKEKINTQNKNFRTKRIKKKNIKIHDKPDAIKKGRNKIKKDKEISNIDISKFRQEVELGDDLGEYELGKDELGEDDISFESLLDSEEDLDSFENDQWEEDQKITKKKKRRVLKYKENKFVDSPLNFKLNK